MVWKSKVSVIEEEKKKGNREIRANFTNQENLKEKADFRMGFIDR